MEDHYLRTISGGLGSLRIANTTLVNATQRPNGFYVIVVVADAVIGTLTEDGVTDSLAEHGITGVTLTAGEVIFAKTKFTSIQLASGVVSIA